MLDAYGMSEAEPLTIPTLDPQVPLGSVGKAAPGFEIEVQDEFGDRVDAGVEGQIVFRALRPNIMMRSYLDDPQRTEAAWRGGWFLTGDLGTMDASGRRAAYRADVAYTTANEVGFDYLRDGLALHPGDRVHRPFATAVIDEVDSILIDDARIPLVIAGNIPAEYKGWFEVNVAPHIDDRLVRYVGPVNDAQKNALLGSARAFLMPISWEEPFGIVMAEAMACGTPVIGFRRGAVPEIVTHGETGFVVDTADEMVTAIECVASIDRGTVRRRCETHFSDDRICDAYIEIYRSIVDNKGTQ